MTVTKPHDADPFAESGERTPRMIALVVAVLLHVVALLVYLDSDASEPVPGNSPQSPRVQAFRPAAPPPPVITEQKRRPKDVAPVPDPDPETPEPVFEDDPLPIPELQELTLNFIGEPTAPSAADGPPGPEPVSAGTEGLVDPRRIPETYVEAEYPHAARQQMVRGSVVLMCIVTKLGDTERCRVLHESPAGHGFAASAVAAVTRWKYIPGTLHGVPVDVSMTVTVRFSTTGL